MRDYCGEASGKVLGFSDQLYTKKKTHNLETQRTEELALMHSLGIVCVMVRNPPWACLSVIPRVCANVS
jgi:hypothetical protein